LIKTNQNQGLTLELKRRLSHERLARGEYPGPTCTMQNSWTRLSLFYLFSFLLLGVIPLVDLAFGGGLMDFGGQAARASAVSGVEWTSSLLDVGRLALIESGLWLLIFGSSVPMIAALIVIVSFRENNIIANIISKINPFGDGSSDVKSVLTGYGRVVGVCLVALAGTALIRLWIYGDAVALPAISTLGALVPLSLLASLLDQGALLEEGGWRGFATPLAEQILSPLMAAVLIGIAWAVWHLPRDITGGVMGDMGAIRYWLQYFPSFALGMIAVSIIAVWGMKQAGGSLVPAILVHGLANDATGLAGQAGIEMALTTGFQLTKAIPFVIIAIIIVSATGRDLRRVPE
jgi:membrane protease YdiL (CAAX protease family)